MVVNYGAWLEDDNVDDVWPRKLSPVCRPPQTETFRNLSPISMAKNPGNCLFMLRFRQKSRVAIQDLKSGAPQGAYGFDPRPGH